MQEKRKNVYEAIDELYHQTERKMMAMRLRIETIENYLVHKYPDANEDMMRIYQEKLKQIGKDCE